MFPPCPRQPCDPLPNVKSIPRSVMRRCFIVKRIRCHDLRSRSVVNHKKDEPKLKITERAMERLTLDTRRTDRWRNERIRATTEVMDVVKSIRHGHMKWRLASHIARTNDNRWTTSTSDWCPRDRRRGRGRPQVT